ncbi:MAG TPA: MFS transporter [Dehalococcoidia bacterium]|nr:MFS transporter [Dehalococcoidia bacterium]
MTDATPTAEATADHSSRLWIAALVLFWITSAVESLGVSQVFAFMPIYLEEMGLPEAEVPHWVGLLSSLVFVLGLPLVPLWGVWADKYSRKAVIIRSAVVEAAVFGLVALSRQPWQLAGSLLLVGFQLGNTGVMLSALRDLAPKGRLGTAIALFGSSSPVGFAVGPAIGGWIVDGLNGSLPTVYALSAGLSLATAIMLGVGFREVRPSVVPSGRVIELAYGAIQGVFNDSSTRRLFALFGLAFLARQMSGPFLPILVDQAYGTQAGLASAVALVVGTAALVGGVISAFAGVIGDRVGFRPVLAASLLGGGLALAVMPAASTVPALALTNVAYATLNAAVGAMIFGLLALELPPDRASATLNLVYLPLYISGIVGPSIGALAVTAGVPTAFVLSGAVLGLGGLFVLTRMGFNGSRPNAA